MLGKATLSRSVKVCRALSGTTRPSSIELQESTWNVKHQREFIRESLDEFRNAVSRCRLSCSSHCSSHCSARTSPPPAQHSTAHDHRPHSHAPTATLPRCDSVLINGFYRFPFLLLLSIFFILTYAGVTSSSVDGGPSSGENARTWQCRLLLLQVIIRWPLTEPLGTRAPCGGHEGTGGPGPRHRRRRVVYAGGRQGQDPRGPQAPSTKVCRPRRPWRASKDRRQGACSCCFAVFFPAVDHSGKDHHPQGLTFAWECIPAVGIRPWPRILHSRYGSWRCLHVREPHLSSLCRCPCPC